MRKRFLEAGMHNTGHVCPIWQA